MRAGIVVFPGINRERDLAIALERSSGRAPRMIWHKDTDLGDIDLVVIPGGFSFGDYLRCGAMAAHSKIMADIKRKADEGVAVLGICNGFQILTEAGLLPGTLMRNAGLKFVCRPVELVVDESQSVFTRNYSKGERVTFPVAHGEGNYFASDDVLNRLEAEGRVAFRYAEGENPNGSARNIAGILNEKRNVLGLMPHPERACDPVLGSVSGRAMFQSLLEKLS